MSYVVDSSSASTAAGSGPFSPPESTLTTMDKKNPGPQPSAADLPRFVQLAVRWAPRKWPKGWLLCCAIAQCSTFLVMTAITHSVSIGIAIYLLFICSSLYQLMEPELDRSGSR